ncbi:MAG: DsrE family protein [Sulfuritalea sp.]|nr:DsrE family protein [Sulfuritalea sp.]
MKRIFVTLLGLFALLPLASAEACAANTNVAASASNVRHRVVIQLNENDSHKWNTVFANINNVQEELGKVDVAVVVIGGALDMLKADALTANRVLDAMAAGVRFVACQNTMKALQLSKDDMIDGISYARAGYVEIMRLQEEGWSYLRP